MPKKSNLNQISHLAKWKFNQQKQIIQLKSKVNNIKGQIGIQKSALAEETYRLFTKDEITEEKLISICKEIQNNYLQLELKQKEIEFVQSQVAPILEEQSQDKKGDPINKNKNYEEALSNQPESSNKLICPKCHQPIPIRFCPNCGLEGVISKPNSEK